MLASYQLYQRNPAVSTGKDVSDQYKQEEKKEKEKEEEDEKKWERERKK